MSYDDSWNADSLPWGSDSSIWNLFRLEATVGVALGASGPAQWTGGAAGAAGVTLAAAAGVLREVYAGGASGATLGAAAFPNRSTYAEGSTGVALTANALASFVAYTSDSVGVTLTAEASVLREVYAGGSVELGLAVDNVTSNVTSGSGVLSFLLSAQALSRISPWDKESLFTGAWVEDIISASVWEQDAAVPPNWVTG